MGGRSKRTTGSLSKRPFVRSFFPCEEEEDNVHDRGEGDHEERRRNRERVLGRRGEGGHSREADGRHDDADRRGHLHLPLQELPLRPLCDRTGCMMDGWMDPFVR